MSSTCNAASYSSTIRSTLAAKSRTDRESRENLRDDHAVDIAGFEASHEICVAAAVGVRPGSLVDVDLDRTRRDTEALGGILIGELALTIQLLLVGAHATVERDGLLGRGVSDSGAIRVDIVGGSFEVGITFGGHTFGHGGFTYQVGGFRPGCAEGIATGQETK